MPETTNEFLRIRGGPGRYDLMTWPNPDDPAGVEWRLRYHRYATDAERRRDQVVAASYMNAYRALVELPQRARNQRISQIRTAAEAARRNAGGEPHE